MPQNPLQSNIAVQDGARVPLTLSPTADVMVASATSRYLNISAATVVKSGEGRIVRINVTTAGSAGAVHDHSSTSGTGAATLIAVIPATVGTYYLDFPVTAGIVIAPGASQVVSVSYS